MDPPGKMFFFHRQGSVRRKGTPEVGMLAEQNGLPEGVHPFQMLRPAILNSFIENVGEQFISSDLRVESVNQQFYVV